MVFIWEIFSEWETVFQKESLHFHTVLGKDFLFQYQVADFSLIFPWRCMCLITQSLGQSLIPHYACDMAYTKAIKMPVFWTDSCVIIMVFNDYNCLYVPCSSGCSIYHAIKFYFDSIYVLNIKCFWTNTIVKYISYF